MKKNMLKQKKILVTGGAGFIGAWLVKKLLQKENKIIVFDNFTTGKLSNLPVLDKNLLIVKADIRNLAALKKIFTINKPEIIFHLAALHFIPYCNDHSGETINVNIAGTQNLLEACKYNLPQKVLLASSAAVYPLGNKPNKEEDKMEAMDIYGLTKIVNEMQGKQFAKLNKTNLIVARICNVYGPNETNPHVIPSIIQQIMKRKKTIVLGNIKPKRNYIFVSDVVQAMIMMAEKSAKLYSCYNVGAEKEYSVKEIVMLLKKITTQKINIKKDIKLVRKCERMHLKLDISRIKKEIGWVPQYDIFLGLKETITSYR